MQLSRANRDWSGLRVLAAVLAICGFVASGADAATWRAQRAIASGPVLLGSGAAWAEYDHALVSTYTPHGFLVLAGDDGGRRTLARATQTGASIEPVLASSPLLLATARVFHTLVGPSRGVEDELSLRDIQASLGTGSLTSSWRSCALTPSSRWTAGVLAVSGADVACLDADRTHVDVYDGTTGVLELAIPAAAPTAVQIAGPVVAWTEPGAQDTQVLVEFDRSQQRETLRLPTSALGPAVRSWSVQDDGTVAYSAGAATSADGRLGWTSPSDPVAHPIASPVAAYAVQLRGGTIAYTAGGRLGVTSLQGPARTLADRVTGAFDFDGTRIAFARTTCDERTIAVRSITAPPLPVTAPVRCPLRLTSALRLVRSRLELTTTVDCTSLPFACSGEIVLRTHVRGQPAAILASGTIDDGDATLALRRPGRQALRRHAALDGRLTATFRTVPASSRWRHAHLSP
ncbi:MAG: hypothetical protein JWQ18_3611 [Conexibacter sp.]|nr:hypothetical protein [Conexibacter sp.]